MTREREEDKRNSILLSTILSVGLALLSISLVFDEKERSAENEKVVVASKSEVK